MGKRNGDGVSPSAVDEEVCGSVLAPGGAPVKPRNDFGEYVPEKLPLVNRILLAAVSLSY